MHTHNTFICSHSGLQVNRHAVMVAPSKLLTSLSQPSHVCDKEDLHRCHKLCEVSKSFLYIRAERWLAARSTVPILLQYGSDCTPIKVRQQHKHHFGQLYVNRQGKATFEYLIERVFLLDCTLRACGIVWRASQVGRQNAMVSFSSAHAVVPVGSRGRAYRFVHRALLLGRCHRNFASSPAATDF
jgi:hypothetical protein